MRAPIVYIELNGEDISELISDFSYEDSLEKDNLLTLKVFPEKALDFLDREDLTVNTDLFFQFGYLAEQLSSSHTAKISDIDTAYDRNGIRLTIKALDSGNFIKKNSENIIYTDKTSSEIASVIADKYGFTKEIDDTTKTWENMPQGNMSDFEFLKSLSLKENDYIFFIRNNILYFKKRGLEEESALTFTYGESEDVISFIPKQKLSGNSGTSSQTLITTIQNTDGSYIENTVTEESTESNTILNSQTMLFDSKDNVLSQIASTAIRNKNVVKTTDDDEEAKNTANSLRKSERLKANEADLTVEGNPLLEPKMIITVAGVAQRHSGNYQIRTVIHKINNAGYICACALHTNGTNSGGNIGSDADDTNKSVGPDSTENTVTIEFESETNTLNN